MLYITWQIADLPKQNGLLSSYKMITAKKKVGAAIIVATTLFVNMSAQAAIVDITINSGVEKTLYGNADTRIGSDGNPVQQSGYGRSGCIGGLPWNNESFGYDSGTNQLYVATGFDVLNGYEGQKVGDIFISTNPFSSYPRPVGTDGNYPYKDPSLTGWCVHFTGTTGNSLTYDLVSLTAETTLETVFYAQNGTGPWRMVETPTDTIISSGGAVVETMSAETINALGMGISDNGDNNRIYSVDISGIAKSIGSSTFYTMTDLSCGNNPMAGKGEFTSSISAVPEVTSSFTLLVLGASGAFMRLRPRRMTLVS